jgi:hypothetical protein
MIRRLWPLSLVLLALAPIARGADDVPKFHRHITALFSKLGCNGGTCHGAVKGKNGFRLSLFGANPDLDYDRLIHEYDGRRIDRFEPGQSLLVLKATGQVAHEGGMRTPVGSPEHQLLCRWIAAGMPLDKGDASRLTKLIVTPAERSAKPGDRYRLKVDATFADGTTEDVTALCAFESRDQAIANVDATGQVEVVGPGGTVLLARYRAAPAIAGILVPRSDAKPFAEVAAVNFIDTHVLAKLRQLGLTPAHLADDATFLRRAYLDVTGALPSADAVRAFLADKGPEKRTRLIDDLLKQPGHAELWTLKFGDLWKASDFGVYADGMSMEQDAPRFAHWLRKRLEENVPSDELVTRILTATSREGKNLDEFAKNVQEINEGFHDDRTDLDLFDQRKTLDLYWQRKSATGLPGTLQIAHSFLGLRLECAKCHRHPHDVWQQDDLLSFANFFVHVEEVGFRDSNEKKYPDVGKLAKKLSEDGKKLETDVKKERETTGKKLEAEAKKSKDAQDEYKKFMSKMSELDRRSKLLPDIGRRVLHTDIRHNPESKAFAVVVSPLGTQESKTYRFLGETKNVDVPKDVDPRTLVVEWMRRPDNPFFAKALVNRVWAHYFGRGIVDPPDNLSPFNPPTHPELLDQLSKEFIAHKFDLRWLHRTILLSRTYQQKTEADSASVLDRANYACFHPRRLPAEVVIDALSQATGSAEDMEMKSAHWPVEWKTIDLPYPPKNAYVAFMLEQFGKPARNSAAQCDCERDPNASVLQVLALVNHPRIRQKIADPKGRVARAVSESSDVDRQLDDLFLGSLSRLPTDAERSACRTFVAESATPAEGLRSVLWSLLNTREFVLQH